MSTSDAIPPAADPLSYDALSALVQKTLDDNKAQDVHVLDVRKLTSLADTMIIASGTSTRHVKALSDHVWEAAKAAGFKPLGVEGERESDWVLTDFGGVIVHVMLPATRAFYDLERLWMSGESLSARPQSPH